MGYLGQPDLNSAGSCRSKPFEDEDYKWRDWFGGREGKRRRETKHFIFYDRKYYKQFILEDKYEWQRDTIPLIKLPFIKNDWQHKAGNIVISLLMGHAAAKIIFNWMQSNVQK